MAVSKKKLKIIKWVIIGILILLIPIIIMKKTELKEVSVEPGKRYSADEIKSFIIKEGGYKNAIYIYLKYKYGEQEKIPFLEYVDIELEGINGLKLTAYDKSVIGCLSYMNQYLYFDNDGVFVETAKERLGDVPFVTGLEFKTIDVNKKMDVGNDDIYKVILNMAQLISQYEIKTDEISFDKDFNVILICGKVEVRLGNHATYDEQIAKLKNILPKTEGLEGVLHMENFSDSDESFIFNKKES